MTLKYTLDDAVEAQTYWNDNAPTAWEPCVISGLDPGDPIAPYRIMLASGETWWAGAHEVRPRAPHDGKADAGEEVRQEASRPETTHEVCALINDATSDHRLKLFLGQDPRSLRKEELRYDKTTIAVVSPTHHVRMRTDVTVTIEAFDPTEVRR